MNEIIEVYDKQLRLYQDIKTLLLKVKDDKDEHDEQYSYESKLKEIYLILDNIEKVSARGEQLKQIYVLKHDLKDFIGDEIKKVEGTKNYVKFKEITDALTSEIKMVKKLQDVLILKISQEAEETWQKLRDNNANKKSFPQFDKSFRSEKKNLIDIKK